MAVKKKTKTPPIFSHEFVIQNHADIVSCIAMLFVIGLLFQATSPLASKFIAMHHNVTEAQTPHDIVYFTYGPNDLCVVFFYLLITIVMHAIVQEYVLDKLNRKLHLSKMKHNKFNESGQLLVFYLISLVWSADIIRREGYLFNINKLWEDYPNNQMTFLFKFYFIIQFSYWLHCYPELYFQKVKKEDMKHRVTHATLYLVFFVAAYILSFTHIAVCLSFLHYLVECIFHLARLLYFAEKTYITSYVFTIWNGLFVLVRLGSIILSVLTFWYGLALSDSSHIDFTEGNFNTKMIRINCLVAVGLLQAWMMWNFITFHLKKLREKAAMAAPSKGSKKTTSSKKERKKREEVKRGTEEDELPEVDQNTKHDLRSRQTTAVAATKAKKN